jgi:BASS family bile acid:Na+ symporter
MADEGMNRTGTDATDKVAANGNGDVWEDARQEIGTLDEKRSGAYAPDEHDQGSLNWAKAYGRYIIAGGLICGLAVPELAALARPLLVPLLIASLALTLIQFDFVKARELKSKGWLMTGVNLCLLVVLPVVLALESKVVFVAWGMPVELADGMILAAMAPSLLGSPVIAFLLGLDAMLALVISIIAHVAVLFTVPLLAPVLVGAEVAISPVELVERLGFIILSGFVIGLVLRAAVFRSPTVRRKIEGAWIDGLSVIALAVLALALMDGVTEMAMTDRSFVVMAFACGFILNPFLQFLGAAIFVRSGLKTSLTIGLLSGYRNTGLLIAVLAGSADPKVLTFLAIVQIPTFLMPMLTSPFMRRMSRVPEPEKQAV